jgi:hypothetical protein
MLSGAHTIRSNKPKKVTTSPDPARWFTLPDFLFLSITVSLLFSSENFHSHSIYLTTVRLSFLMLVMQQA